MTTRATIATVASVAAAILLAGVAWLIFGPGEDDDLTATDASATSTTTTSAPATTASDSLTTGSDTEGTSAEATTTASITEETVEPDETIDDSPDPDAPAEVETSLTTPATLPAAGFDCGIALADLNGTAGVVTPVAEGPCANIEMTVRAVAGSGDVADTDWTENISVCEKHPSAGAVDVAVVAASGTTELTEPFFRGDVAAGVDPLRSIDLSFAAGFTPPTGVQPVVVCRTSEAEVAIVFRAPR